jgi:hypothetical protein
MFERSVESTIHFSQPFRLTPFDRAQPAGSYQLITEEEQLEGLSFAAFRRVRTLLYLPAKASSGRVREVVDVDPHELAAVLIVDALQSLCGRPATGNTERPYGSPRHEAGAIAARTPGRL